MDSYYQLSNYSFELSGTLVSIEKISKDELVKGRMPENEYEIVIDKKIIDNMLNSDFSSFSSMGIKNEDELLNKIVNINDMKDFTIVGFTDNSTESIYANKSLFINILNNMTQSEFGLGMYFNKEDDSDTTIKDYNLY
ncbi:MAG: hypothetical protein ACLU7U_02780, partial [Romboutsia timonensis]